MFSRTGAAGELCREPPRRRGRTPPKSGTVSSSALPFALIRSSATGFTVYRVTGQGQPSDERKAYGSRYRRTPRSGRARSVLVIGLDGPVTAIDFHDHVVAHVDDRANGFFGEQWAGKRECHARLGLVSLNGSGRSQDLNELRPGATWLQTATGTEIGLALLVRSPGPCARQRDHARESQDQRPPTACHQ